MRIPKAVKNLMEALERLPGIGSKTAARLTFYLLHVPEAERQLFGRAVLELGAKTAICERCFNICDSSSPADSSTRRVEDSKPDGFSSAGLCEICADGTRDQLVICVVEDPLDLMALEKTGKYKGLYHVLHGAIAPLERIGPEDLKIDELVTRLKHAADSSKSTSEESKATSEVGAKSTSSDGGTGKVRIKEVILATNPSLEGEATAMYIKKLISNQLTANSREIKITRIARGIPTGGDLEYADEVTLAKALEGRTEF